MALKLILTIVLMLAVIQLGCEAAAAKGKGKAEAIIAKKLKGATPAERNKYKMLAAKRLQTDLGKAMRVVSSGKDVPADVALTLQGLQSGKLTQALASSIPNILQTASVQQGKPGDQLQTILGSIVPNAPSDMKNPLQGTLNFLSSNLGGMNNLLGKVAGGVPDMLSGTVKSLTGTLGAVTDSLSGSVGSLGTLMGGLLAG